MRARDLIRKLPAVVDDEQLLKLAKQLLREEGDVSPGMSDALRRCSARTDFSRNLRAICDEYRTRRRCG